MTDTARQLEDSRGLRALTLDAAEVVDIGSTCVRFLARSADAGAGFSLIECAIPPCTLVAPLHCHSREDEYSFVLEGRMAALLGDQVVYAEAGELTFKPRGQWHTVWNPHGEPSRILEIISPGGFERFFEEFAASLHQPPIPPVRRGDLGARYGVETDYESVRRLCAQHGPDHPLLARGLTRDGPGERHRLGGRKAFVRWTPDWSRGLAGLTDRPQSGQGTEPPLP